MNLNIDEDEDVGDGPWRWEIEPNPYDSQYDYYVTNDDNEAYQATLYAAEMYLWDGNEGETRTLKVKMNPKVANTPKPSTLTNLTPDEKKWLENNPITISSVCEKCKGTGLVEE